MKGREFTFPKWLGLLIALGGLVSGLWVVQEQTRKSIMAAAEEAPAEESEEKPKKASKKKSSEEKPKKASKKKAK